MEDEEGRETSLVDYARSVPRSRLQQLLAWAFFYAVAITSVVLIIIGVWQGPHRQAEKNPSAVFESRPELLKHEPLPWRQGARPR